jgi:hypothetical protein
MVSGSLSAIADTGIGGISTVAACFGVPGAKQVSGKCRAKR